MSAASRTHNFVNMSHDGIANGGNGGKKPQSMIIRNRNELVDETGQDLLDDDQNSAHQHMTNLNNQKFLKSSLEPADPSAPLPQIVPQNVNNSCVLQPTKQTSG